MRKFFVASFLLFGLIAIACSASAAEPTPISNKEYLATIVAGTLTANPTETTIPSPTEPPFTLDTFPVKIFVGEDARYAVYMINPLAGKEGGNTGELLVLDKMTQSLLKMSGSFSQFGSTIVTDDGKGQYVALSTGTYTLRQASILSLNERKRAVDVFCHSGEFFFWKDFIIFENCDKFNNRPWGAGEAPSIAAIALKTGKITQIAKADLTHAFKIKAIEGDNLQYNETSVETEDGWKDMNKVKTVTKTYSLLMLEDN